MSEWTEDPGNAAAIAAAEARGGGAPDYLKYIQMNPGLREATEAQGMTQAEVVDFAKWHWTAHGEDEFSGGAGGRLNTPFETQIPTEITAQPNPTDIAGFEEFIQGSATQPLSEMWAARAAVDPAWNVGQFSGEGWNFDPDNPYARGILGDTIAVDAPVGQLYDTGDPRFLQDRYQDPYIEQDFPVGWTTPQNTWAGPEQLGGYWDAITNAQRNELGELRSVAGRPETGWAGPSVSPGTRGGGNVRGGGPPNPAVPSFGFPGYQDWEPFMPTDFPLAAASGGRPAGWRYQPWVGAGMGGGAGGFAGPDLPQGYNTGGGLLAGGVPAGGPGPINPNIWGGADTTGGGNTTTDTSGNKWVMTPGGQWVRADSDYGQGLTGQGRLFYDQHYDSSGNYVGAEGQERRSIMTAPTPGTGGAYSMVYVDTGKPVPGSRFGTPWQDTFAADWINENWGINPADQRSDAEKAADAQAVAESQMGIGTPAFGHPDYD